MVAELSIEENDEFIGMFKIVYTNLITSIMKLAT